VEIVLILNNIRSVHNVGSIFRTADAAGVTKIILAGYSPTPLDRFGRERSDFAKVSLGAEKTVPWEYVKTVGKVVDTLKAEGYQIVAIEQHKNSTPLFRYKPKGKVAVVMGNEVRGISAQLLKKCDKILEIPMHGKKESLNVSVSAGIALFSIIY
jgi:tRNA G18 (ribose-2'-O)-methylase SpoU